ncbi:MAG: TRAP transporter small permease subunit [Myxococcales bacterium]|nr:TRAP transporter small permease subunit [Myxococcales bacterium]
MKDAPSPGAWGWLRRLDDAVFAAEQALVATFLSAMTVMVFVDVVYRRLSAPDSKIGALLIRFGGLEDEASKTLAHQTIAPILGIALAFAALWFGFWTAERYAIARRKEPGETVQSPGMLRPLGFTLATMTGLGLLGTLMTRAWMESRFFYLLLYGLVCLGFFVGWLRKKPTGWVRRALGLLLTIPVFVWFALSYFPFGYTWSKEVSLIMLLWVGFVGSSICVHEGKHIELQSLSRLAPERFSKYSRAIGLLIAAAFCGFMLLLGHRYVFDPTTGAIALGGVFEQTEIPDWTAIAVVPIVFGLMGLRLLGASVSAILGGSYGLPKSEEDELREAAEVARAATRAEAEDELGARAEAGDLEEGR